MGRDRAMSWLQILILGVAVGFGGDFFPFLAQA